MVYPLCLDGCVLMCERIIFLKCGFIFYFRSAAGHVKVLNASTACIM